MVRAFNLHLPLGLFLLLLQKAVGNHGVIYGGLQEGHATKIVLSVLEKVQLCTRATIKGNR